MSKPKRLSRVPGLVAPLGPYSHAVVAGDTIHVAGQVPVGADGKLVGVDDFAEQARQAYRNLGTVLEAAGSDLQHLLRMTVYLTDMSHLEQAAVVRREFVAADQLPTSTVLEVSQLADPLWMIEVEATAQLPGSAASG